MSERASSRPNVLIYGEDAVLVELGDRLAVRQYAYAVRAHPRAAELTDVVPAQETVMLVGPLDVISEVVSPGPQLSNEATAGIGRTIDISIRFDGEDLPSLAESLSMSSSEVIDVYCAAEHSVDFFGFAPGLAYFYGVPEELRVPRRATPRTRVPAGSLGIANGYTVIYPAPTPAGWTIIGTLADEPMWTTDADPPNRVDVGDTVRFRPV